MFFAHAFADFFLIFFCRFQVLVLDNVQRNLAEPEKLVAIFDYVI